MLMKDLMLQGDEAHAATVFTYATSQINYMLGDTDETVVQEEMQSAVRCMLTGHCDWLQGDEAYAATLFTYATSQINYMLGDAGRSYVVGFGKEPPTTPFHKW